jgi:hypothetical protein
VSRQVLRGIAENFQTWLKGWAGKRNIPVVEAPRGRRDEFVEPYFNRAKPEAVVVILKAREPARIITAIGDGKSNRWRSCDREPLGRPIQLLHQRSAMGTHVRADLSLPSVLGARLS